MKHAPDEIGAHVSAAGGTPRAPGRATALDAIVMQLFTKQPNRWAEREAIEVGGERKTRRGESYRLRNRRGAGLTPSTTA